LAQRVRADREECAKEAPLQGVISTIVGGFAGPSTSTRKKHLWAVQVGKSYVGYFEDICYFT